MSDVYLQSHERGRRHQEAVARLPDDHAPLIITLDEENTAGELESKVAQDQLRSGRRRTRKLRQRMAARSASYAEPNFARKLLKHLLLHHYKKIYIKLPRLGSNRGLHDQVCMFLSTSKHPIVERGRYNTVLLLHYHLYA